MKKNKICGLAALLAAAALLGGCSQSGGTSSDEATAEPAATLATMSEYALIDGFTQYNSPDGGFSVQLPEGSVINDADVNDVTITVASDYDNADMVSVKRETSGIYLIENADQLDAMLGEDYSSEVSGFTVLTRDGEYCGYKYSYSSMGNDKLKGVVSMYMNRDGSAYRVEGIINNGDDPQNVEKMNTIVDTFVSYYM